MELPQKVNLGFFPTPISYLKNISQKLGLEIYIKRDDQTGLAFGGNKTRKLEFLIAEAIHNHSKAVVTEGAPQSNHVRQTAAAAVKYGLKPHLILFKPEPAEYNGNLLLDTLFDAKIHWVNRDNLYKERLKVIGVLKDCYGQAPYFIPMGGSNETGLLGYIKAMEELKNQIITMDINFDFIVFASSSGGTQAGMILGKKIFNLNTQIIGIEIDKKMYPDKSVQDHIKTIINYAIEKFGFDIAEIKDTDIILIKDYDKAGYGVLTDFEQKAIKYLAQNEGILLDPVYTGRAFAGLLDLIEKNYFPKKAKILFWHTGGTPALFAYADKLFKKQQKGKDNLKLLEEL